MARALTIFACAIPTEGAPSLRFLRGWAAMLRVLFGFVVDARDLPTWQPAFPTPALRKKREGPLCW
jgi:hypothetical protein